jgi:hypothetical protein
MATQWDRKLDSQEKIQCPHAVVGSPQDWDIGLGGPHRADKVAVFRGTQAPRNSSFKAGPPAPMPGTKSQKVVYYQGVITVFSVKTRG